MSLRILVFAKQVPDTHNISGDAMKEDGTVNRAALPAVFNPEDLNGLEMALQLRKIHNGTVTVVSMGPPAATAVLRQALYMGADEAILVSDRKFAGADTLATSYTLACAAGHYGEFDLIICGRQAIDGDTAQVGPQLAEKLDLPQISYVEEAPEIKHGRVRARCIIEGGHEIVESPMPVLLTAVNSENLIPRSPGAKRIAQFKKAKTRSELQNQHAESNYEDANFLADEEDKLQRKGLWIHEWSAETINADPERIGLAGSPTKVKNIESVVLTSKGFNNVPPTEQGIRNMVHELLEEHILT